MQTDFITLQDPDEISPICKIFRRIEALNREDVNFLSTITEILNGLMLTQSGRLILPASYKKESIDRANSIWDFLRDLENSCTGKTAVIKEAVESLVDSQESNLRLPISLDDEVAPNYFLWGYRGDLREAEEGIEKGGANPNKNVTEVGLLKELEADSPKLTKIFQISDRATEGAAVNQEERVAQKDHLLRSSVVLQGVQGGVEKAGGTNSDKNVTEANSLGELEGDPVELNVTSQGSDESTERVSVNRDDRSAGRKDLLGVRPGLKKLEGGIEQGRETTSDQKLSVPSVLSEKVGMTQEGMFTGRDLLSGFGLGFRKDSWRRPTPEKSLLGMLSSEQMPKVSGDDGKTVAKGSPGHGEIVFRFDLDSFEPKGVVDRPGIDSGFEDTGAGSRLGLDSRDTEDLFTKLKSPHRSHLGHEALLGSQSSDRLSRSLIPGNDVDPFQRSIQGEVLTQIVEKWVPSLKGGQRSIKIALKPEILGRLGIRVSTENHQVMVRIITESPLVKGIIESNLNDLRAALQNHGLEIDDFGVFVAHDSDQYGEEYHGPLFSGIEEGTRDKEADSVLPEERGETDQFLEQGAGINLIDFFA